MEIIYAVFDKIFASFLSRLSVNLEHKIVFHRQILELIINRIKAEINTTIKFCFPR